MGRFVTTFLLLWALWSFVWGVAYSVALLVLILGFLIWFARQVIRTDFDKAWERATINSRFGASEVEILRNLALSRDPMISENAKQKAYRNLEDLGRPIITIEPKL